MEAKFQNGGRFHISKPLIIVYLYLINTPQLLLFSVAFNKYTLRKWSHSFSTVNKKTYVDKPNNIMWISKYVDIY